MKKLLSTLIIFSLVIPTTLNATVFANPLKHANFPDLINALIDTIWTLSLVFAPLMIVVGAFYFFVPGEGGKNIETGKKIITYTLIGFIIIIAAKGIIELLRVTLV